MNCPVNVLPSSTKCPGIYRLAFLHQHQERSQANRMAIPSEEHKNYKCVSVHVSRFIAGEQVCQGT